MALTLFGDGEHDDTEALFALFRGVDVSVCNDEIHIDGRTLRGGTYRLSDTIRYFDQRWTLSKCTLIFDFVKGGKPYLSISGPGTAAFFQCKAMLADRPETIWDFGALPESWWGENETGRWE